MALTPSQQGWDSYWESIWDFECLNTLFLYQSVVQAIIMMFSRDVLFEVVDCCIRFIRKNQLFSTWRWLRAISTQGPKNAHHFSENELAMRCRRWNVTDFRPDYWIYIWILFYVTFCTIMAISRQKEARSRDYALLLFRMTSRVLYGAQYHRQHCKLHAFEQFGALYMHNHDDKYPSRPGFVPGTPRLQAPVDTNEPSGRPPTWLLKAKA